MKAVKLMAQAVFFKAIIILQITSFLAAITRTSPYVERKGLCLHPPPPPSVLNFIPASPLTHFYAKLVCSICEILQSTINPPNYFFLLISIKLWISLR